MTTRTLEAMIASPPERDDIVVQLFIRDGEQWAEMFFDKTGHLKLELYPQTSNKPWLLDATEVINVLTLAKNELTNRCVEHNGGNQGRES